MAGIQSKSSYNGHAHESGSSQRAAQCPYCGTPISRKEFEEIRERIEAEERARIGEMERALTTRFARQKESVEAAAKAAIEKARREAAKVTDTKLKAIRENQAATITAHLRAQEKALKKQMADAVTAERIKAFEVTERLNQQLAQMQRRLEQKTAHQLGEPSEANLFDAIVAAFPANQAQARRVPKGTRGADVIFTVVHDGAPVGKVVVDSKNHSRWSNGFVTKLRGDQLAENADFGVLSTNVFPKGTQQLHIQDSIIIADPGRVVALLQLLRRMIVINHRMKLTAEERDKKGDQLLAFLTSATAEDQFHTLATATNDLIDLEAHELDQQTGIHRKRGQVIRALQSAQEQLVTSIDAIVAGAAIARPDAEVSR